jgi:hypothetical protein
MVRITRKATLSLWGKSNSWRGVVGSEKSIKTGTRFSRSTTLRERSTGSRTEIHGAFIRPRWCGRSSGKVNSARLRTSNCSSVSSAWMLHTTRMSLCGWTLAVRTISPSGPNRLFTSWILAMVAFLSSSLKGVAPCRGNSSQKGRSPSVAGKSVTVVGQ